MHVPTHIMAGWCIGNLFPLTPHERIACMAAASLPDLDGLSILAGESAYQTYHHLLGHNLLFALVIATTLADEQLVNSARRMAGKGHQAS